MDITRLQPSILEMTAAQSAYDTALRELASATRRATQEPLDREAAAQLQLANQELAQARIRVDSAWRQLDVNRLLELTPLVTGDQILGSIPGHQVLGLFPVSLEARLDPGRLRIRVWPDAISTSTHDPRLTEKELQATKRYWRGEATATDDESSRAAWQALCDEIGVTRAAWAAQVLTPTNRDVLGPNVEPVFPIAPLQDDAAPFVPRASVLPDRWIAIGVRNGAPVFEHVGAPIPLDLAVGLDTTPGETANLTNREGEPIQLPPRMRWMTDFALGVQAGMAMDVPLAAEIDRLDELLVLGVRITQTPAQNADTVTSLFTGHRLSRGLAFVPQNTPTNNSIAGGSGLPSRSERIDHAFDLERQPRAFPSGVASNGVAAARAFGIPADVFASVAGAGSTPDLAQDPDGFEPHVASAMQTALWQVTLGAALEDFLLLPASRVDAVREYFRQHVRAAGPAPAVRVGRQPYGILPVTTITDFIAGGDEGIDGNLVRLLSAARSWFAMRRRGNVFEGDAEGALRHLGRSVHLFAETTQQNASFTGTNRWATLARTLAVATRNQIGDTWRNSRIKGTVDGFPQPVTRPIVNESTASEIDAFATALPASILNGPLPESVLSRMVRQAALLEWGRLARAVCEASVDEASTFDLSRKANSQGSSVYINVLTRAFTETPTGPGPLRPPVGPGVLTDLRVGARRRDDDEPFDPTEPEDPEHPTDPRRPPLDGDLEVNPIELQQIRTLVGNLASPLASCPGAARLASFRQALTQLARFPAERLESEMFGVLDICNHRIDAWFTSLATRRLATLRASNPSGLVMGGWGCLQDVRRIDPASAQQRAEFIHTPSLDQAAAAAVLRSGARRAHNQNSHHADIDLSSRRVRLARWVLEGVRNGRSVNELLGARFERTVKTTAGIEAQLGELRSRFPGFGTLSVLDGLALQQGGLPLASTPEVAAGAAALDETLDAVADALTAEAVYQIVKGNPVGALISMESIAAGNAPPELHVTETPPAGVRLTHRIVLAVPAGATAPGWTSGTSPRSNAEPLLDAWCGLVLGPPANTSLTVIGQGDATASISLAALDLAAIDVVMAGRNGGAELAEVAVRAVQSAAPGLVDAHLRDDRSWKDLTGLCHSVATVLTSGTSLQSDAFDPPSAMVTAVAEDFGDLPARVSDAIAALTAVRDALVARTDQTSAVLRAALFGIRVPGALLGALPTDDQQGALLAAIETRLQAAVSGTPRDRLRALFGGDLPGVITFTPRDPDALVTASSSPPASLLDGNPTAPRAWLDASGRTHAKTAALADVLLRREIMGDADPSPLVVAQAPWSDGDRWIATSFTSRSRRPPSGRLSVLIHAPGGFTSTQPIGGLLLDAWTETIPAARRDTAMALRFNNASTRAPQAILLAVSPNPALPWNTATLVNVLMETLMLTRLRMQPATTFSGGGLMPCAWLGQRANNAGISFSL